MALDFADPELLAHADARTVATLVAAASDLALVVDGSGVIDDLSSNLNLRLPAAIDRWRGRPVDSVVEPGSVASLNRGMKQARAGRRTERFGVNHLIEGERSLPVEYSAIALGDQGRIVLMGRDLRPISELQSRLLANRQVLERSTRSQKQAEAHYRLLFETGSDAVVFLDAETGKVRELNARAGAMLGMSPSEASGRKFASLFDRDRQGEVRSLLSRVAASGMPERLRMESSSRGEIFLSADLFRAGGLTLTMVRLDVAGDTGRDVGIAPDPDIETLVRNASEAIVMTDVEGGIVWANESFLVLTGVPLAANLLGKPVGDFIAWTHVERESLFDNVRRYGRVPSFTGTIRGAAGQASEIDLSAIAMPDGATPGYGFVMRVRAVEAADNARGNSDLMRTAENLAEMVGRVPMKDLVRDTTDVIERMCIEAALKLTGNNRASTARVLGLSRQALYLKMNRFGIADSQ